MTDETKEFDAALKASQTEVLGAIQAHADETAAALKKADEQMQANGKVAEEVKNEIAALTERGAELDARMASVEQELVKGKEGPAKRKSIGEIFAESEAVKEFAGKRRHKGQSGGVEIDLKTITSANDSAGAGIIEFDVPGIVSDPYPARMLRSLIPTVPVSNTDLIRWVRTNVRTNEADVVSEAAEKPKSSLSFEKKQTAISKIAHYFKASDEVLSDFPRLQAELNMEGMEMLKQVEETQLMSGDGVGENILGLIPQASPFNTAVVESNDHQVDILRRAALQVRQSHYSATGIVLNPADWAQIELLKDNENRYLFSAVTSGAPKQLWGLPVVESDALAQGEFLVGSFALAATIYDRMALSMWLSTENEDDFINNLVTILFEERLALAVKRPLAFVHGYLSGESS